MSTTYWQISAGAAGRDYTSLFLRWGIAFVGGAKQLARMREVEPGDVMILKRARSKILAAGRVVERDGVHGGEGDKEWLEDVDGWRLPGYCYVDWHTAHEPIETNGLKRTAIQRAPNDEHQKIADKLVDTRPVHPVELEPGPTRPVSDEEILQFLIAQGRRTSAAEKTLDAFRHVRRLAEYYRDHCRPQDIREHEIRTFLVVPLLQALGWSERQMKIEYPCTGGRVDLVCFQSPQHMTFREAGLLVETKDLSKGLHYAARQARNYAAAFPDANAFIVTNGYCYKAYVGELETHEFGDEPSAYLNVLRPRDRYPLGVEVGGTVEVLSAMAVESVILCNFAPAEAAAA